MNVIYMLSITHYIDVVIKNTNRVYALTILASVTNRIILKKNVRKD